MAKQTDIEKYLLLLEKIRNNEEPTTQELEFFISFAPKIDETKLAELTQKAQENQLGLSPEELTDYTSLLAQKASTSPATRDKYLKQAQEITKQKAAGKVTDVLNTALAVGDIVTSQQQINEARKLARQSRRPTRPAALTKDPLLQQAIFEAQQGNFDVARRLAPAQQEILNQYLSDMNVARTASTGQAGTYGALGQVASTRRGRGAQQLVPMADEITRANQQRLDNLLQLRLNENQAIQQSQAQMYPYDLNQYRAEQEAIGSLGAQGRQNMRQSLVNLGGMIPQAVGDLTTRNRFARLKAIGDQYGVGDTLVDADARTLNNWSGAPTQIADYQYLEQLYGNQ